MEALGAWAGPSGSGPETADPVRDERPMISKRDAKLGGPGSRRLAAACVLAVALVYALAGGCSKPTPLKPAPVDSTLYVPSDSCDSLLPVFTPFPDGLAAVGTDTTLDLATWNLEFFPLSLPGDYDCPHPIDGSREQAVANLINLLRLDIIAVEEISDAAGFQELLDLIPGYGGILSPEVRGCNYQRPGLIYRKDQVTIHGSQLLFTEDSYAFPRSPLQVDLTISARGHAYDLHIIVVHLKASSDSRSQDRRRAATEQLRTYLDQQAVLDPEANYMIAGDWNDVLNEPVSVSSFPAFLGSPSDYKFLDMSMAGNPDYASLGNSLIDHLMVNQAACADFADARVATLRLDNVVSGYRNISDHRPVMVRAPLFR